MNAWMLMAVGSVACASAGVFAGAISRFAAEKKSRRLRREAALGTPSRGAKIVAFPSGTRGLALRYAEAMTRRLYTGTTEPVAPCVRNGRAESTRAGACFMAQARAAGCSKDITTAAFCEARVRLTAIGAVAGMFAGLVFSAELAVLLGCAGALAARSAPLREMKVERRRRAVGAERHLSEMLEVVSLGLRSGLTFDRGFALYGAHFDNEFAVSCAKAHRRWSLGLTTREEALRELAESYDCEQLARVVDNIVRSLKFGSALSGQLEDAAALSRATYRTSLEERVAKAPVKMMLPTGTLILPAMLLLVMGPILLELAGGF